MIEHIHPEGEPTPTAFDLVKMGPEYAVVSEWTLGSKNGKTPPKPAKIQIKPKGHLLLGEIAWRNAVGTETRGSAAEERTAAAVRAAKEKAEEKK